MSELADAAARVAKGETVRLAGEGYALRFGVPEHRHATLSPVPADGLKAGQRVLYYDPYNAAYIMGSVRKAKRGRLLLTFPWGDDVWVDAAGVVGRLLFEDARQA
jgi:hypothetical protein